MKLGVALFCTLLQMKSTLFRQGPEPTPRFSNLSLVRPPTLTYRKSVLVALLGLMAVALGAPDNRGIAAGGNAQQYATTLPEGGFVVDRFDRDAVVAFFQDVYVPAEAVGLVWNGLALACRPGTTSTEFHQATADRINYYRAMAGVPADIVLHPDLNAMCEQAALMMAAEDDLSHHPGRSFSCYTDEGAWAAGKSNLTLGRTGPGAIDLYMEDPGDGNTEAGHRRWILNPPSQIMGSGNALINNEDAANALWVLPTSLPVVIPPRTDDNQANFGCNLPKSDDFPQHVAWPPDGFLPKQFVAKLDGRWSFSYPGADFSQAEVTVSHKGRMLWINAHAQADGYGLNTLVWQIQARPPVIDLESPGPDVTYSVTIDNFIVGGESRSVTYDVVAIDVPGEI